MKLCQFLNYDKCIWFQIRYHNFLLSLLFSCYSAIVFCWVPFTATWHFFSQSLLTQQKHCVIDKGIRGDQLSWKFFFSYCRILSISKKVYSDTPFFKTLYHKMIKLLGTHRFPDSWPNLSSPWWNVPFTIKKKGGEQKKSYTA